MGRLASRRDYQRRVAPHSKRAFDALRGLDVPKVHFGVGSGEVLDPMHEIGADVIGVDWRLPLDDANQRLGGRSRCRATSTPRCSPRRGNPRGARRDVLERGATAPAHVVNLGHGVPPDTDPDVLTRIVELVHASVRID